MPTWLEVFQFVKDPYEKLDPYKIDLTYLVWDRPDLAEARRDLDLFNGDIFAARRCALKVFGSSGAGKTWLTRLFEKEILLRDPQLLFIYTKIPKLEPTFPVIYRLAIDYLLANYFDRITEHVKHAQKGNVNLDAWKAVILDEELATAFSQYYSGGANRVLARRWITGDRLSAADLDGVNLTRSLDSDYDRFEMLIRVFENLAPGFSGTVFVIDELENASVKLAGQLSDSLRDMLDRFAERFALLASFTAEKDEEWYDLGYTEQLNRRFDYTIGLEALSKNTIADFLRIHHQAYRKHRVELKDQLSPFNERGAVSLLEVMSAVHQYPGYYLPNCRDLVRSLKGKKIDAGFVKKNKRRLTFK